MNIIATITDAAGQTIAEFIDHGVDRADYFQGCGVSGSQFTDVATGIGMSLSDALHDAVDQIAMQHGNDCPLFLSPEFDKELDAQPHASDVPENEYGEPAEDTWHYASIRYKA